MSMYGSFVVPDFLATSSDYEKFTDTSAPANINQVLRSCTSLILDGTLGVLYDVDATTGLATDPGVNAALNTATCMQAQAWVTLGIDPADGGVAQASKTAKLKKIGSASIEYSDAEIAAASAARQAAYTSLIPDVQRYLAQRNLLATDVWSRG